MQIKLGSWTCIDISEEDIQSIETQIAEYKKQKEEPKTLEDCQKLLNKQKINQSVYGVGVRATKYIDISSRIQDGEFPSNKRPKQLIALMKLMQVADALNGEDCFKLNKGNMYGGYFINFHNGINNLGITDCISKQGSNILFKSVKLAQKAIEILGEETIKQSLGVFKD